MLPIPPVSRFSSGNTRSTTDKSKSSSKSGIGLGYIKENEKPEFLNLLESIAPSNKEQTKDINELWRDLPALERELIETKSQDAMERYKNQIRSLLQVIIKNNTRVQKQFTPIRGSSLKKEYSHIEIVDEKLKILAETIAHHQNSAFQILKQMDSIKGFLLDIEG
jgi:uncharacterized protein YaaR (DUF327 family)